MCCDCTDGCRDPNICACLRLRAGKAGTVFETDVGSKGGGGGGGDGGAGSGDESAAEEGPGRRRFYNDDGLLLHLPNAIFECDSR